MKTLGWNLWIMLFLISLSSSLFSQNSEKPNSVVFFQPNNPVIVAVSNKPSDGEPWKLDTTANSPITLVESRPGYLFTYFTVKISDPQTSLINFITNNGKKRSFTLQPLAASTNAANQEIYGDIPSTPPEGFLSQTDKAVYPPTNPNPASSGNSQVLAPSPPLPTLSLGTPEPSAVPASDTLSPVVNEEEKTSPVDAPQKQLDVVVTKNYIQKLIDNNLIPQARQVFDTLVTQPEVDTTWKYLTDLKLSKLGHNYQDVLDKSSQMLTQAMPSEDTELAIRKNRALASENLGKLDDAESDFLYNTSYFPRSPRAYTELAEFYLRHKQYKKALQQLLYITSAFPNIEDLDRINYQIARSYYNIMGSDGYNLALGYYEKVLHFGPNSPYYQKSKNFVDFLENNLLSYH